MLGGGGRSPTIGQNVGIYIYTRLVKQTNKQRIDTLPIDRMKYTAKWSSGRPCMYMYTYDDKHLSIMFFHYVIL